MEDELDFGKKGDQKSNEKHDKKLRVQAIIMEERTQRGTIEEETGVEAEVRGLKRQMQLVINSRKQPRIKAR